MITMDGKEVTFRNTMDARKQGISIIHQELSLFPNLNVYQNIFMNNEKTKRRIVLDNQKHRNMADAILKRLKQIHWFQIYGWGSSK